MPPERGAEARPVRRRLLDDRLIRRSYVLESEPSVRLDTAVAGPESTELAATRPILPLLRGRRAADPGSSTRSDSRERAPPHLSGPGPEGIGQCRKNRWIGIDRENARGPSAYAGPRDFANALHG